MSRLKTPPELVQARKALARRLVKLRTDIYGDASPRRFAERLGIPIRSWYSYEAGMAVPGEIILRIMESTGVEPLWLLHGTGPMYRAGGHHRGAERETMTTVWQLVRAALEAHEWGERVAR